MSYWYSKDEFDAMTGGFHPATLCGEDCSGCVDEGHMGTVPISSLDRASVAQLCEEWPGE